MIPEIKALDQNGETRNLASLTGERGLLLMFSRSFDWCPFCIRQMNQLVEVSDRFAALDMGSDGDVLQSQSDTSSQGYGLGLAIVQRLCERNGWAFSLHADEARVAARLAW